jgi:cell division protein FtsL
MAERESIGGTSRRAQTRSSQAGRTYVYVDGTAVRKLQETPVRTNEERKAPPATSKRTRRNRERALQMNFGYVSFLTVAAVITVFVCVNFLQLQAKGTKLQKEVTALETQLDAAALENASNYQQILNNVDMEYVKDVAMNELGMIYTKKNQIVTY